MILGPGNFTAGLHRITAHKPSQEMLVLFWQKFSSQSPGLAPGLRRKLRDYQRKFLYLLVGVQ